MPGNVAAAVPTGVMPQGLCLAFSEAREYPILAASYHDGTQETSLVTDGVNAPGSIRTWKQSKRLKAADAIALRAFFEGQAGGLTPFYYYNPFEVLPGTAIGSNWDPTGSTIEGRHTVVFRGNWTETVGLALTDMPAELAEIA